MSNLYVPKEAGETTELIIKNPKIDRTDETLVQQIGDWRIVDKVISAEKTDVTAPGTYKVLYHKHELVMSSIPQEYNDFENFRKQAKGNILINGLGLGLMSDVLLDNPKVTMLTIIEKNLEVIQLTNGKYNNEPRVEIIKADAFEYYPAPDTHYDSVWHDIWSLISEKNVVEMDYLKAKYQYIADYQECWKEAECRRRLISKGCSKC
jgi:hypothetical protein